MPLIKLQIYALILLIACCQIPQKKHSIAYQIYVDLDFKEMEDGQYVIHDTLINKNDNKIIPRLQFQINKQKVVGEVKYFTPNGTLYLLRNTSGYFSNFHFFYKNGRKKATAIIKKDNLHIQDFWDRNGCKTVDNYVGYIEETITWQYILPMYEPSKEIWQYQIKNGQIVGNIQLQYFQYQTDSLINSQKFTTYTTQKIIFQQNIPDFSWNISHNLIDKLVE